MTKLRRLPPETVIRDYVAAYERFHGTPAPELSYDRGWYRFRGIPGHVRSGQIIHMTATLNERAGLKPKG